MSIDFRTIIKNAASRKLVDLAKTFLDIVDELKKEEQSKIESFMTLAESNGLGEQARNIYPFLFLLSDNKKEILRKRILDKTNEMIRELDQ
jgi:hypothetical protein